MRQHEGERLDEMRRDAQHHLALGERFGDETKLVVLEVAQSAVDELGAPLRRRGREVVLLDEEHRQAAARGVAGDPGAVDAAADDEEIVDDWLHAGARFYPSVSSTTSQLASNLPVRCRRNVPCLTTR